MMLLHNSLRQGVYTLPLLLVSSIVWCRWKCSDIVKMGQFCSHC